jgi:hypothetical protein
MNPLDTQELELFSQVIKNDLPLISNVSVKVKSNFSQSLPKNLKQYCDKVNNQFLNDNLHIIEEMEYRKKGITASFKDYQNRYYKKSEALDHDMYFKHEGKIISKVKGSCGMLVNSFILFSPPVSGGELVSGGNANHQTNWGGGYIWAQYTNSLGTVTNLYDQIALNIYSGSGSYQMAVYSDTSLLPIDLLANTGTLAGTSGFTYKPVTEFSLTTAGVWLAMQMQSSSGLNIYWENVWGDYDHQQAKYPNTFGNWNDPFGTPASSSNQPINMKVGHS